MVDLSLGSVWGYASGTAGMISQIILLGLVMIIIGAFIALLLYMLSYKHTIVLKKVARDGRKIIFKTKFKEHTDSNGVNWWKLLKYGKLVNKGLIPIAPTEAIEIDSKGKMYVECAVYDTGEVNYLQDTTKPLPNFDTIQEKEAWLRNKQNRVLDVFQPLNTKQRLMLINQLRAAEAKRKKDWKDQIVTIAGIFGIVILCVCLMIFYEDMAKPLIEMGDKLLAFQNKDYQMLELMKELKYDIQQIEGYNGEKDEPPN